jgi:hypothetical protein
VRADYPHPVQRSRDDISSAGRGVDPGPGSPRGSPLVGTRDRPPPSAGCCKHPDLAAELSKEAANHLADLSSFPFQNNTDVGLGEFDRSRNILNIRPVIPVAKGKIITRTILPVTSGRTSRRNGRTRAVTGSSLTG